MSDPVENKELETRVLALLENNKATAVEWITILDEGRTAGVESATREWGEMAQEALAKANVVEGGIELLKWRAETTPMEQMTPKDWLRNAELVAGSNPHRVALIEEAGFGQRLAARECVRRFRLLHSLKPGALVLHRTWGFGVVKKADSLYKKILINFKGRPGHGLAMKVAAETLELLSDEHLLAQHHKDKEAVQQLVAENPAEVVRIALASFGPLQAAVLQKTLLDNGVVQEQDWKKFWDGARKVLKADPMVSIPTKRSEPIRLLDSAAGYDDSWFDKLSCERNIKTLLSRARELADDPKSLAAIQPAQKSILSNRMAFVLLGATSRQPGIKLMGALLSSRLGLTPPDCDWPAAVREFLRGAAIVDLLHDLPARELKPTIEFLWAQDAESTRAVMLAQLKHFRLSALSEVMAQLLQKGAGEDCRQIYATACATHLIREEMLLWVLRNPELREAWDLPLPCILSPLVVEELEQDYMGDRLKTQKLLREKFEENEWLEATFNGLTPGRQRDFFKRLNLSSAWPGLDRQVLQAKILKLYPHLQSVITGEADNAPVATYGAVTSHRTYRERQEELEKLINVDIPANAKEISVARSHGDLRENQEYKAAKEMQSRLMSRRAELESMFSRVRPTDFSEAPSGVAGVGATVTLEYPGGKTEQFHILGEWDQQPDLNIISSNTRLAKSLADKKQGGEVVVTTEEGKDVTCILKSIDDLAADIKEWVK